MSESVTLEHCEVPETGGEYDHYIRPVRGIILTHDRKGRAFSITDLKKWIRLHNTTFHSEKIDVIVSGTGLGCISDLLSFATTEKIRLSLRTDTEADPEGLGEWAQAGLLDIFLCPKAGNIAGLERWMEAAEEAKLPVRVQLVLPVTPVFPLVDLAFKIQKAASVNLTFWDPLTGGAVICRSAQESRQAVAQANMLMTSLSKYGVEINLLGLPFCLAEPAYWPSVLNSQQFHLDHQQYQKAAYEFACRLSQRGPYRLGKAVENLLARRTSLHNAIDNSLFPWITMHPRVYVRAWMFHKLTRHLHFLRRPRPLPENVTEAEAGVARLQKKYRANLGPVCAACRLNRICDHQTASLRKYLPGLRVQAQSGDDVATPLQFAAGRKRYYDAVDTERLTFPAIQQRLAEEARHIILREPPTREIAADDYDIEDHYTHHMPGAVRWMSFLNVEHRSTVLTRIEPPFTMTLTFGGGIASHIGFIFGRHARLVCPMFDYSHRLTLHVDEQGHYALLRDGILVRPTEFEGERGVPDRLAGCLEPRINIHNVDGIILTQTLLLWEKRLKTAEELSAVKYSVIIVCTRFSRRLQATLLSLAHQRGVDMRSIEVVIAYVPGIDGTDDLIDAMRLAHPELRIVRSPFSEDYVRAKGFMINESLYVTSGEWIVLLDADILPPPDFFERIDAVEADTHFIAPDGRKMLSPETTAQILLGQLRPWEDFEAVASSEPAFRYREANRTPIGFCQCVRRKILKKIPYHELDHFESSDWWFGYDVQNTYGKEKRIEGMVVLHLDHGGSQWYGVPKQM